MTTTPLAFLVRAVATPGAAGDRRPDELCLSFDRNVKAAVAGSDVRSWHVAIVPGQNPTRASGQI